MTKSLIPTVPAINYELLTEAQNYYRQYGFEPIDAVPWIVPQRFAEITAPQGAALFPIKDDGVLVASAEQSALYLKDQGLPVGRYSLISPCFRDDKVDEMHFRYFMKLELIDTQNFTRTNLNKIVEACCNFFNRYVTAAIQDTEVDDPVGIPNTTYDIVSIRNKEIATRIELGSYGMRKTAMHQWIYATGCAEPRLSYAISQKREQ